MAKVQGRWRNEFGNTIRLSSYSKECHARYKTKNTVGPEAHNWNHLCHCPTSNNAERMTICCTRRCQQCSAGHFEHLCVYIFWGGRSVLHTVLIFQIANYNSWCCVGFKKNWFLCNFVVVAFSPVVWWRTNAWWTPWQPVFGQVYLELLQKTGNRTKSQNRRLNIHGVS